MKRVVIATLAAFAASASVWAQQASPQPASMMKASDAVARMSREQAQEAEAYTLGVQAVLWGMQWVKAGQSFRLFSRPLPAGQQRSPYDPLPHAVNIWGQAQKLLNADTRN